MSDFLGTGWSFPPTFHHSEKGVSLTSAETNIQECMAAILSTLPGERILHPDFGCDLHQFVFEEKDQRLITGLQTYISDAILYYEPRIEVNEVEVEEDSEIPGCLQITIDYTVKTTNSRNNLVFPFYLDEANSATPFPVNE